MAWWQRYPMEMYFIHSTGTTSNLQTTVVSMLVEEGTRSAFLGQYINYYQKVPCLRASMASTLESHLAPSLTRVVSAGSERKRHVQRDRHQHRHGGTLEHFFLGTFFFRSILG